MPGREVTFTFRLWQVVFAFAAVTASFVIATVIATNASNKAGRTADQAKDLAVEIKRNIAETRELRERQLEIVQKIADSSCASRHDIVSGQIAAYEQSIVQARVFLKGPGGQLPGVREAQLKSIRLVQRLLVKLRKADCHSVPSILHPKKKPGTP